MKLGFKDSTSSKTGMTTFTYLISLPFVLSDIWAPKGASPVALVVKNPPANQEIQEMWVRSLGWEDPLKEGMVTHSSILAWKIPWPEEPGR